MAFPLNPETLGDLYHAGASAPGLDSKLFVDAVPRADPAVICESYARDRQDPAFNISTFLSTHFRIDPENTGPSSNTYLGSSPAAHIEAMWPLLTRRNTENDGTLIGQQHAYITPSDGPYFREQYYWDTLFTNLGLTVSGRHELARGQIMNLAAGIERDGYVRNSNRTYMDRTQEPVFALMVEGLANREGESVYLEFLSALLKEDAFFRRGEEQLADMAGSTAVKRIVRMPDDETMDRPFSDSARPRPERCRADILTAALDDRPAEVVYRAIRAGAEHARDYGSAILKDGRHLHTIHTPDLVTVQRNSFRALQEKIISKALTAAARHAELLEERRDYLQQARLYKNRAAARSNAIIKYNWNQEDGFLFDYDWVTGEPKENWYMGAVTALYAGILTPMQATLVGQNLEEKFQRPGGLATSLHSTDLMWDGSLPVYDEGERAVGFALDQYLAYVGLRRYGQDRRAFEIAERWLHMNAKVYRDTGQFYENYDVNNCTPGYGGEKPVQSGFAWTNGVNLWLENQMIQAGREPSLQ